MYEHIRGKLVSANPLHAVLEAHGVGYKLLIPASSYPKLPAPGEELLLYTTLVVRETSHQLFGFLTPHDRTLFETLTSISGIGPKTALGLIGNLPPLALQEAVSTDNPAILARVPGVGKKTAERLIVELRDKLPTILDCLPALKGGRATTLSPTVRDAISALINLGYTQAKAQTAIQKSLKKEASPDLPDLITSALQHL